MRRLALLAVVAFLLAACGGSGASKDNLKITFGLSGGTMMPYSITIAPDGTVTTKGGPVWTPKTLESGWNDADLSRAVRSGFAKFKSTQCPGTFPDESSRFITALGKTITVRGNSCEPGFAQLWQRLTNAVTPPSASS